MAYATFSDVTSFDGRVFGFVDWRRIFSGLAAGLGTLVGAVLAVGVVAFAVLWMAGIVLSTNPHMHAQGPSGPATLALANDFPARAGAPDFFGSARIWSSSSYAPHGQKAMRKAELATPKPSLLVERPAPPPVLAPEQVAPGRREAHTTQVTPLPPARAPRRIAEAAPERAAPADIPAPVAAEQTTQRVERLVDVPLPRPHPPRPALVQSPAVRPVQKTASAPAAKPVGKPAEKLAMRAPIAVPPPADLEKPSPSPVRNSDIASLPPPGSRTAVYDISAHTVFMPDGSRLEAHSGLGRRMDNPHYVSVKDRGPTPPNVYHLSLRRQLFHGVRAIRLNPVNESDMFGRAGILAHTYMLGPSGQSFGCVSFKHYQKFLQAFLSGEVDRMVVVPRLGSQIAQTAAARRHGKRYAFNDYPDGETAEY